MNGWLAEYPEVHGGQQPLPCPPARPVSSCGPSHGPRASATPHFDPDWPSNIGRRCCIISPGSCWFESELSLSCFCSQREISCAAVCCALMPYAEVKHGHRCFSQLEQEILSDMAINSFSVHEAWCPHKDTCLILLVKKVKRPTGTPKNWDGAGLQETPERRPVRSRNFVACWWTERLFVEDYYCCCSSFVSRFFIWLIAPNPWTSWHLENKERKRNHGPSQEWNPV